MKVKEESEKVGWKLHIQNTKIMASSPMTSWQIDWETVADFILLGSRITADGACSHEIKRRLLLGRKVMTHLDSILKSRDIVLSTKVCLVKAMVFPVVMYGCESWTIKKAECWSIDAFELWCWRRLLRVPWTAKRCNQPILKETNPGHSLKGLMLKLKLQYFGHMIQRADPLEVSKNPESRKYWGQEEKGMTEDEMVGRHHQLNGHGFGWTPGVCDGQGGLVCCGSWGHKESDTTEWLYWMQTDLWKTEHRKSSPGDMVDLLESILFLSQVAGWEITHPGPLQNLCFSSSEHGFKHQDKPGNQLRMYFTLFFIPQKLLYLEAVETLLLDTRGQKSCPSETIAFRLTDTGHDPAVFPLPFLPYTWGINVNHL